MVISAPFHAFENPVNRTYRLDSPPIIQGLFASYIYVGSGDPVRVLRLLHTTNTLDTLEAFIAETYVQLVATELHATLLVAAAQLPVILYCMMA